MQDRSKTGNKATTTAILINTLLAVLNVTVGIIAGSTALIASASDSISDILASAVTAIAFRIGLKKPDQQYQLGYGRAEPISGLMVSGFILIIAYFILMDALNKLFTPGISSPSCLAVVMGFVAVILNLLLTIYLQKTGTQINSPSILSLASHNKTDVRTGILVSIGLLLSILIIPQIDPIIALVVCIMVAINGIQIGKHNIENIMGKISPKLTQDIQSHIISIQKAQYINELKINSVGAYYTVYVELYADPDLSLDESYDLEQIVEKSVVKKFTYVQWCNCNVIPY